MRGSTATGASSRCSSASILARSGASSCGSAADGSSSIRRARAAISSRTAESSGLSGGGVATTGELLAQRGKPGRELLDPRVGVGNRRSGGGKLFAGARQRVRELVGRDDLGREAPLEVVELGGESGLALAIAGELLDPRCERLELLIDRRIVNGLGCRADLGEPGAYLRELVGEPVDARVGERGGGRGQLLAGIGERPGEMLRCDDVGREPALDLLEPSLRAPVAPRARPSDPRRGGRSARSDRQA